jgi:hypothetical protein
VTLVTFVALENLGLQSLKCMDGLEQFRHHERPDDLFSSFGDLFGLYWGKTCSSCALVGGVTFGSQQRYKLLTSNA